MGGEQDEPFRGPASIVSAEQHRWRERLLTGICWSWVAATATATFIFLASADRWLACVSGAQSAGMLVVAAFRHRIRFHVAVWLLLGSTYASVTVGTSGTGLAPNVPIIFGTIAVFATLLLGMRSGLAWLALTSLTLVTTAALHRAGLLAVLPNYRAFAALPTLQVARIAFVYTVVSSVNVVAISYPLKRAEGLLLEKAGALDQLQREKREGERMRCKLARQETAVRKARELEILGRLAGTMAHDFNHTLAVIQGSVEIMRREPSYFQTGMREILEAVRMAASTTRELRAFSPQLEAHVGPVDLGETVARTTALLRRVLPPSIQVALKADGAPLVLADEGQLQRVLTNLALNARDAMPGGGTLELSVREADPGAMAGARVKGRHALLEVVDDGAGMSAETQARLFEPYFTTKGPGGTGLGLASVKALVEASGGRILVTSALGQGTRIRIFWPIFDEAAESPRTHAAEPHPEPPESLSLAVR